MTQKGVWDLQDVRDEYLAGNWVYNPYAPIPDNNEFFSFGRNDAGGLGLNDTVKRSSPTQVPGTQWKYVAAGNQHAAAMRNDNTLWTFGTNSSGRLGQNSQVNYSSPIQVPGTWARIYGGRFDGLAATKTDGTLWAWGTNTSGTLAQNNRTQYSSPKLIPGTTWDSEKVSVGDQQMAAIKTDGTLWVWGKGNDGGLGLNDEVTRSSPTQVPGTNWSEVETGTNITIAIKTDGSLWAWGTNTSGILGQNGVVQRSSPVQIPGTQWNGISLNDDTLIGTKTDGTLWTCGRNEDGQCGQNHTSNLSSPTQISGTQWQSNPRVVVGYTGYRSVTSLKTDGTAWTWGSNSYGQLGQNSRVQYSSPIQITGTGWNSVSVGPHTLLLKEYS